MGLVAAFCSLLTHKVQKIQNFARVISMFGVYPNAFYFYVFLHLQSDFFLHANQLIPDITFTLRKNKILDIQYN
jgi:hypothetical protein